MVLQTLEALDRDLRKGEIRPVYLVLGPEQYQCNQAIALLKKALVPPDAMAFDYSEFTAGEIPIDEVIKAVNTFPMISKRRLVLVNEIDKLKEHEQDALTDSIGSLSRRGTLVLAAEDLDHRRKFYKTLRDQTCVAEFPKLKGPALEKWSEDFVRNQGFRISGPAVRKIVELAGSDLNTLAMELEKLILYAGESKSVPDSAVDELVRGSRQQSIFELTGAVGRRDRSAALKSLSNLLSMGEHPLVVVTMLARHCRQVLIAQECIARGVPARDIGTAAQIPPFVLDQFLRQVRSVDPQSAKAMFVRLAEIDRRLKSSAADGRMLLESLICALV